MTFHMKSDGNPAPCTASVRDCPLGKGTIHGETKEELYKLFEAKMQESKLGAQKPLKARGKTSQPTKEVKRRPSPRSAVTDPQASVLYAPDFYWDWNAKQRGCGREIDRGEECTESYCHHRVIRGVYMNYTMGEVKQDIARSLGETELPRSIEDALDPKVTNNFVVEKFDGYYGEEVSVRLKHSVEDAVMDHYYSNPNAVDNEGALAFARVSGQDTSGLRPVEATKALLDEKSQKLPAVQEADMVSTETVPLANIKFSKRKLTSTEALEIPKSSTVANNLGGVLVKDAKGEYTLVSDDYSRFKAVTAMGRKNWRFLVLDKHPNPNPHRWWVKKEQLLEAEQDVSDW